MGRGALDTTVSSGIPERVLLFSGHMVDRPDRPQPRFPADKVAVAARRIAELLASLASGPGDIAFTQGAAGGDLLFAEACLARGVDLHLLLPLPEKEFIAASILPSADGANWQQRYRSVCQRLHGPPAVLAADDGNPYVRGNQWLLQHALAWGAERLHFICLWDGSNGDGDGGTADMIEEVRRRGGRIDWIDSRQL
ncbi:MAG: hypothetical protein CVU34_19370 [Betaproteobacteria bacterium HGW-Betaproteobacteria-7]|jgi:hypothetical protein|nr:MAG: hypothetical protein CVU34_19370 [Betaproteobacteria bacterium HGW-Betaproteobacteria-7]